MSKKKKVDPLDPSNTPTSVKTGKELSGLAPALIGGLFILIVILVLVAIARRGETGYNAPEDIKVVSVKKAPIGDDSVGEIEAHKEPVKMKRATPTQEIARMEDANRIAQLEKQVAMVSADNANSAPEKNIYWDKYIENQLAAGQARQDRTITALQGSSTVSGSGASDTPDDTTQDPYSRMDPMMQQRPLAYDNADYSESQQMLKNQMATMANAASASAGGGGPDQNMQGSKNDWFDKSFSEGDYNDHPFKKVPMKSKYTLQEGDLIDGIMVSGINSDLPGTIIAHVGKDVYDSVTGTYLLIPQGTELTGRYSSSVSYGQDRVAFGWTRMIFSNGDTINLGNMGGVDQQGYSGVKDQVDNHYIRLFGQIALVSFFQAIPALINPTESSSTDTVSTETSTHQEVVTDADGNTHIVTLTDTNPVTTTKSNSSGGTDEFQSDFKESYGTMMAETGVALAKRNMSIQPTLNIRQGHKFKIIVTRDMILPPQAVN